MPEQHIPLWGKFEYHLESSGVYKNLFHDVQLSGVFTSPSGKQTLVDGFWDGGQTWRIRFCPDEQGLWHFITSCNQVEDDGLHNQETAFVCSEPISQTVFDRHGLVGLSSDGRYFAHADGTPFFWMGDTVWNGPLRADDESWANYLDVRRQQGFNVVQWVATQWRAASQGDEHGSLAFTGREQIALNPTFFQRLDRKIQMMNQAGFLSVPVLLWAHKGKNETANHLNPGFDLPEDQAVMLARYMLARWGADHNVWILAGDGDYDIADVATRWKRIGHDLFDGKHHAPVTVHPISVQWTQTQFEDEAWFDFISYQSGHGDSNEYTSWLVEGPPAMQWKTGKPRPVINLEPPYENHIAYHSRKPFDAAATRKRLYWSLLVSPPAGVTYGGHGVWGWDDGTQPPEDHESTGVPLAWREALTMPAAEQITHLVELFKSRAWWRLRPAQEILVTQLGIQEKERFVAAARSDDGLVMIYIPEGTTISLKADQLPPDVVAIWFNPRTGERHPAHIGLKADGWHVSAPDTADWLLELMPGTA